MKEDEEIFGLDKTEDGDSDVKRSTTAYATREMITNVSKTAFVES